MAASLIPAASKGWNSSTVQEFRIPGTRENGMMVHPLQEMGKIGTSAAWGVRKSEKTNENYLPASSQTIHILAFWVMQLEKATTSFSGHPVQKCRCELTHAPWSCHQCRCQERDHKFRVCTDTFEEGVQVLELVRIQEEPVAGMSERKTNGGSLESDGIHGPFRMRGKPLENHGKKPNIPMLENIIFPIKKASL